MMIRGNNLCGNILYFVKVGKQIKQFERNANNIGNFLLNICQHFMDKFVYSQNDIELQTNLYCLDVFDDIRQKILTHKFKTLTGKFR